MLRLDAADAATFDDVAVAEAERFAAADAVLRTKLLSMLAYMFECRARFEDIAASTAVAHQTNEAIAKEVVRVKVKSSDDVLYVGQRTAEPAERRINVGRMLSIRTIRTYLTWNVYVR